MRIIITENQLLKIMEVRRYDYAKFGQKKDFRTHLDSTSKKIWINVVDFHNAQEDVIKAHINDEINTQVRLYTKPLRNNLISKEAAKLFLSIKPFSNETPFDLVSKNINYLGRTDKPLITFDHSYTISDFVKGSLLNCRSESCIRKKLKEYQYPNTCILTLEENQCLKSKGKNTDREDEGGWEKAYRSCGIQALNKNQYERLKKEYFRVKDDDELRILAGLHPSEKHFEKNDPVHYYQSKMKGDDFFSSLKFNPLAKKM